MAKAVFEKLSQTDKALYGPKKLVLCGFSAEAQGKFKTVLEMAGLSQVPVVWALSEQAEMRVGDLFSLPADSGAGSGSRLPRAILVAGIPERALHGLMSTAKKAGMKNALWAALTPTSENWTLSALLSELQGERALMEKKKSR